MSDLIDREQAIKLLNLNKPNVDKKTKYAMWQFDKDLQTIKTMPSAEKTGKWIKICRGKYMCSSCGVWYTTTDEYGNIIDGDDEMKSNNYCSNCGARMFTGDTNFLGEDGREEG